MTNPTRPTAERIEEIRSRAKSDTGPWAFSSLLPAVRDLLAELDALSLDLAAARGKENRQGEILAWAVEMFGPVANSRSERAMRFVEEALELGQSCGLSSDTVGAIISRVYSRRAGQLDKEMSQAGMTLEALAENIGFDLSGLVGDEFNRVREIPKEEWTRRHAAKTAIGITADRSLSAPSDKGGEG